MHSILMVFLVVFPILMAFLVYPLRHRDRKYRDLFNLTIPGIELLGVLALLACGEGSTTLLSLCGVGLRFACGSFQSLLALVTAFMWLMTALSCRRYFAGTESCNRFYMFWLMTLGALMGVFLAADLFTLFVFFEIMSFTSYVWVAQNETPAALRAGQTYLAVSVVGGMVLLVGLLLLNHLLGTLELTELSARAEALPAGRHGLVLGAGFCCLFGFGAKAGMFPLHIWLPKAHPVAPAPASALLSGILTKSGVFGILIVSRYLFWADGEWNRVVLFLGTITMVLGAVLALFSVDLKRTLACSSMSQIGFILIGVAMQGFLNGENALAAWGTVLHMLNHSLIKLVLFIAAGVIYLGNHHQLDLDTIRGWGRNKPWLMVPFFVGAASICGIPGFSGYISKTLLHESIVEYIHLLEHEGQAVGAIRAVEWLFLISGGLTVAYMTKIFVAVFVEKRAVGQKPAVQEYMSHCTRIALTCGTAVLAVLGVAPTLTMQPLAVWAGKFLRASKYEGTLHYFSLENLKGAGISIAIGAAIYFLLVRTLLRRTSGTEAVYPNLWPEKLDLENLIYRPTLRALCFLGAFCARVLASVGDMIVLAGEKILFLRAPGVFEPKRTENFGAYGRKPRRFLIGETFAFDLILAGAGLILMLLYVLFH